jgi:hypothetical protein
MMMSEWLLLPLPSATGKVELLSSIWLPNREALKTTRLIRIQPIEISRVPTLNPMALMLALGVIRVIVLTRHFHNLFRVLQIKLLLRAS